MKYNIHMYYGKTYSNGFFIILKLRKSNIVSLFLCIRFILPYQGTCLFTKYKEIRFIFWGNTKRISNNPFL